MAFSDQKVLFLSEKKVTVEIFVFTKVLYVTALLAIALVSENSTNSLKVESKTN